MISLAISTASNIYIAVIFIYVLMSWFPHDRGLAGSIYEALGSICEPYLGFFRRLIPPAGGIDFSPIVAIIVLKLIARLIIWIL